MKLPERWSPTPITSVPPIDGGSVGIPVEGTVSPSLTITNSALMVIVSDGDTVPSTGMPTLPPSIGGTLVIGVGDHLSGSFIGGQQSRQDESTLRQVAIRTGGEFHNGNRRQVPSDILNAAAKDSRKPLLEQLTLREYALIAVTLASFVLALLPVLLHYFGTRWRPGVQAVRQAA